MAGVSDTSPSTKVSLEAMAFTFKQCGLAFCPKSEQLARRYLHCRDGKRRVCEGSD